MNVICYINKCANTYQFGGSVGAPIGLIPAGAGGEVALIPDDDVGKLYGGLTISGGLSTPGGEVHTEWNETTTFYSANIFDGIQDLCNYILNR